MPRKRGCPESFWGSGWWWRREEVEAEDLTEVSKSMPWKRGCPESFWGSGWWRSREEVEAEGLTEVSKSMSRNILRIWMVKDEGRSRNLGPHWGLKKRSRNWGRPTSFSGPRWCRRKKAKTRTSLRSRNRGAENEVVPKSFEDLDGEGGVKKAKPSHWGLKIEAPKYFEELDGEGGC